MLSFLALWLPSYRPWILKVIMNGVQKMEANVYHEEYAYLEDR